MIVNNAGLFQQNQFGENSIVEVSQLSESFIDGQKPNWVDIKIKHSQLEDESQYLQLGTITEFDFFDMQPAKHHASSY